MTTIDTGDISDEDIERWAERLSSCIQDAPAAPAPTAGLKPFDIAGVAESVRLAYRACKEWLNDIICKKCPPYMLSLLGRSGCGKTHLAKNARATLCSRGIPCIMCSWAQAITDMKEGNEGHIIHSLRQHPVLILDDVGAENLGSEWARENSAAKLCDMLNGRQRKWTLLTSNFPPKQFAERYDTRVASRIHRNNARIIQMKDAEDYAIAHYRVWKPDGE